MILYFSPGSGKIENEKGQEVSVDNAMTFCLEGKVKDCNIAFQRWVNNEFDVEKTLKWYEENE